jgi:hypothetical protein
MLNDGLINGYRQITTINVLTSLTKFRKIVAAIKIIGY